jgi:RecA-family ATPase
VKPVADPSANGIPPDLDAEALSLRVQTAQALCAEPDPPASDELLGQLVIRGHRTVIGGRTGEGKTTLTLRIAQAVVAGSDFLDWQGGGGRALIVDAEQGARSIKRQLREAGLEESEAVDYLRVPDGLSLDTDTAEIEALEAILAEGDYALVVADPLYKLHRGDANEERQAVDLMRRLDAWRSRFGFALILNVHLRKRPPQGAKLTIESCSEAGRTPEGPRLSWASRGDTPATRGCTS